MACSSAAADQSPRLDEKHAHSKEYGAPRPQISPPNTSPEYLNDFERGSDHSLPAGRLRSREEVLEEEDPFGDESGADVHYKTMSWWHCGSVMIAETISLGVLSLPHAVARLGLLPGLVCILCQGVMSMYTSCIIGQFKLLHPHVTSFADCGFMIAGKFGREVMAISQNLFLIFIMAAHIVAFSVAMNALTEHAACTIAFMFAGCIICGILSLPRTLKGISVWSYFSCASVAIAVLVAMVGVGIMRPGVGTEAVVQQGIPIVEVVNSILNIAVSYAGHAAYFGFASELKKPKDFYKSVLMTQVTSTVFYAIVGLVVYHFVGPGVMSPALGSASPTVRKVAYGLAMPTIIISGVVNGSVVSKYAYTRWCRHRMHHKNLGALIPWWLILVVVWVLAWLIAESIPTFSLMLAVISALFVGWFSYGLPSVLWFHMNRRQLTESAQKLGLVTINLLILTFGAAVCFVGLYASIKALKDGEGAKPWSCKSNYDSPPPAK